MNYNIYIDGGCSKNGSTKAIGVTCFQIYYNKELMFEEFAEIGYSTNNIAEYMALIKALSYIIQSKIKGSITIYTDSKIIYNGVNSKKESKILHINLLNTMAVKLNKQIQATIHWIPREENKAGHFLEEKLNI